MSSISDFTLTITRAMDSQYYSFRAGLDRLVDIQNSNTLMDVASNYLHVYMQPDRRRCCPAAIYIPMEAAFHALLLPMIAVNCSGDPLSCSHRQSERAQVDGSGLVSAGTGEGFATIQVSDRGNPHRLMCGFEKAPGSALSPATVKC